MLRNRFLLHGNHFFRALCSCCAVYHNVFELANFVTWLFLLSSIYNTANQRIRLKMWCCIRLNCCEGFVCLPLKTCNLDLWNKNEYPVCTKHTQKFLQNPIQNIHHVAWISSIENSKVCLGVRSHHRATKRGRRGQSWMKGRFSSSSSSSYWGIVVAMATLVPTLRPPAAQPTQPASRAAAAAAQAIHICQRRVTFSIAILRATTQLYILRSSMRAALFLHPCRTLGWLF